MTQGNLVLQSIQNDPSWEQFRGHGEEKLTKAMKTLNDKVGASDFNKKAIMMELAQLRKTMECAIFDTGCKNFSAELAEPIAALAKEAKRLVNQHQAGVDVDKN